MRFKLTEVFNTRYLYVTIGADILYMFSSCKRIKDDPTAVVNVGNDMMGQIYDCFRHGSAVEFDLADAKITPDVIKIINDYQRAGFKFVDSAEAWRNGILKENERRLSIDTSDFVPLPCIPPKGVKPEVYIKELRSDVVYKPVNENRKTFIPLLAMITILRPSVKICLDEFYRDLFTFVSKLIMREDLYLFDEFYVLTPEGVDVIKKDQTYYVQQAHSYVPFEVLLDTAILIPTDFGKKGLFNHKAFKTAFDVCLSHVNAYLNSHSVTISEVVGV